MPTKTLTPSQKASRSITSAYRHSPAYVSRVDWLDVISGRKTEYRLIVPGGPGQPPLQPPKYPGPLIIYTEHAAIPGELETALVTIEGKWSEPVGAITEESLAREGFASMSDYRRYMAARYPTLGYAPRMRCMVRRVHPMTDEERGEFQQWIWDKLFGRWAQ